MLHLACRTDYSFMRGYGKPENFLERCKQIGAEAFGLADYCSTWGHIPFMGKFEDVKLIYGVQVPVVEKLDKDPRHALVALLARNNRGLHKLYEAMSRAHDQTYYRPRLSWGQVNALKEDIAIILVHGQTSDLDWIERCGYVGIGPHSPRWLQENANELQKPIAIAPVAYPTAMDKQGYDLLQAISPMHKLGEVVGDAATHMLREDEFRALWPDVPDSLFRTAEEVSHDCNAEIEPATNIIPPKQHSLRELCEYAAKERGIFYGQYKSRLSYELDIIEQKGIGDYFHFVADLVRWAKSEGMFVGPARGSSGGSLVCYLLGITTLDPIRHGTMFERFIDITRSDWPDIDVDFPDAKRERVFQYLKDTYGEDRVARLGTVSKFGGRSAVNDTGKAYKISWDTTRALNAQIPDPVFGKQAPLGPTFKENEEAKKILDNEPGLRDALLIEGHPRHHGVHAAGVVVTNEPVTHFGVVDKEGTLSVDLDMAEKINLMKMDALGLITLSVIEDCCEQVGIDPQETLYNLTFDDPKVWEIFNRDEVTGIFQFEGNAVRQLMKRITVSEFEDLCALTSLARPGPLVGGAAENWVRRRAGEIEWDYMHPAFEPYLNETYGTIVYQEQAMKIVQGIGGFPVEDVNKFRKAIGKKIPEQLRAYEEQWMKGASDVIGEELAEKVWEEMEEFGSYAFNKSHAVAYSMLTYICAYLKAYHPLEFAVAQLRQADEDKTKALLRELDVEGYSWVAFDPHKSDVSWSIIDGKLYGGFLSVKGVGTKTAQTFIEAREADPDNWLDNLTDAQRKKLTTEFNTPWADLNRFRKMYGHLYEDPDAHGIRGPIHHIRDIPGKKGNYCFLATCKKHWVKEKEGGGKFMNLIWEDDTGECGSTINRFKYNALADPLLQDGVPDGKDFVVRGNIINDDGRVWLFIENLKELKND